MTTRYYTRSEILTTLAVEEDFLLLLEREAIVIGDAPEGAGGEFSARMLERVRVADNLVHDLDVNLAGAGIIVRMREELLNRRKDLEEVLLELRRRTDPD